MGIKTLISVYLVIVSIFVILHYAFCINKECDNFVTSKQGKIVFLILLIFVACKNISLALLLTVLYITLNETDIIEGNDSSESSKSSSVSDDLLKKAYRSLYCLKCKDSKDFYSKKNKLSPTEINQINSMRKEIGITYNDPIITGKSNSDEGGTNVENDTCNICDNSCNSWDLHYIPSSNNVIEGMTNKKFNPFNYLNGAIRISKDKHSAPASAKPSAPASAKPSAPEKTSEKAPVNPMLYEEDLFITKDDSLVTAYWHNCNYASNNPYYYTGMFKYTSKKLGITRFYIE